MNGGKEFLHLIWIRVQPVLYPIQSTKDTKQGKQSNSQ